MRFYEIVNEIIATEWPMFSTVNGENRVSCQENPKTFRDMRMAQFNQWSREAAESYLADLRQAEHEGRNLLREKYIYMMENTAPAGYEILKEEVPEISEKKEQLIEQIWERLLEQTVRVREKYPLIALGGRPLRAADEMDGWASVETYQIGELKTYSEQTLQLLLDHIRALENEGIDLAYRILEATLQSQGFKTMDDAEAAMDKALNKQKADAE